LKPITVRRWALWGGIAAVALIALALALRPAPVEVDVASVSRGRLAVTLDDVLANVAAATAGVSRILAAMLAG